mgnify:CR=1 FL=1
MDKTKAAMLRKKLTNNKNYELYLGFSAMYSALDKISKSSTEDASVLESSMALNAMDFLLEDNNAPELGLDYIVSKRKDHEISNRQEILDCVDRLEVSLTELKEDKLNEQALNRCIKSVFNLRLLFGYRQSFQDKWKLFAENF